MTTSSQKFRMALLRYLAGAEGEWLPYKETMEFAAKLAKIDFGMKEIAYPTLKKVRVQLQVEDLVEMRRSGQHFEMRATEEGVRLGEDVPDTLEEHPPPDLPSPPYRIGKGHLMPSKTWKLLTDQIRAGSLDLLAVPHDRPVKGARYWDE
jgi:hypothetical protein